MKLSALFCLMGVIFGLGIGTLLFIRHARATARNDSVWIMLTQGYSEEEATRIYDNEIAPSVELGYLGPSHSEWLLDGTLYGGTLGLLLGAFTSFVIGKRVRSTTRETDADESSLADIEPPDAEASNPQEGQKRADLVD